MIVVEIKSRAWRNRRGFVDLSHSLSAESRVYGPIKLRQALAVPHTNRSSPVSSLGLVAPYRRTLAPVTKSSTWRLSIVKLSMRHSMRHSKAGHWTLRRNVQP